MVEKIDVKKFDELIAGETPVVCDFYADWCGPCKMLAPVIDKCSEKFTNAKFVKVNVDESFELAARYGVMSIPMIGVSKGGELADKSVGFT
ncbi:MAG: thioredoxin, partial [Clostridia bacterium]|nr:thioredoxin [Clostridia bacterium]